MDPNGGHAGSGSYEQRQRDIQVDNAIRAIQEKKPLPEIDFTIHTMEDGTQVSTMERVSKGESQWACLGGGAPDPHTACLC
jgi:serine/threonine-protein phosphatase 2B catalytic subunit